jgi:hypothetical protein
MTIIVKHKRTGNEYILLGINGGENKTSLPSRFLNDIFTKEEPESYSTATLCDAKGNIFFSQINELIITEIEGKKPSELLPKVAVSSMVERFEDEFNDEFEDEFEPEERDDSPLITPPPSEAKRENSKVDDDEEDWI